MFHYSTLRGPCGYNSRMLDLLSINKKIISNWNVFQPAPTNKIIKTTDENNSVERIIRTENHRFDHSKIAQPIICREFFFFLWCAYFCVVLLLPTFFFKWWLFLPNNCSIHFIFIIDQKKKFNNKKII